MWATCWRTFQTPDRRGIRVSESKSRSREMILAPSPASTIPRFGPFVGPVPAYFSGLVVTFARADDPVFRCDGKQARPGFSTCSNRRSTHTQKVWPTHSDGALLKGLWRKSKSTSCPDASTTRPFPIHGRPSVTLISEPNLPLRWQSSS